MAKSKWRTKCIDLIKAEMAGEKDEQELKDMANAMSGLVPYKPSFAEQTPMPVYDVKPRKGWGRKKRGKK